MRLLHAGDGDGRLSLIKENPRLDESGVWEGLEGNLCRCTGYHNVVAAVLAASVARVSQ